MKTLSGDAVFPFAFGAMQFGARADARASAEMYESCRAAGIVHFDTAHGYTGGASEEILGRLAAPERERVFVATKAGYTGGAGRDNILATFDISRKRLGMDVVDLLYMHRFDDATPLAETIETLAGLQQAGKIRHIGVSNYAAWQVMKAQALAVSLGTRIDVIQPMYNLVKRQAEVEILPMCASEAITAVPYSPLGGGLLTGKYASGGTGRLTEDDRYAARYGQPFMHAAAQGLAALGARIGTDPATLAVAWVAAHPARPHPILSARSAAQLRASLDGMRFPMDAGLYAEIAALSPTPPPATDRIEEQ